MNKEYNFNDIEYLQLYLAIMKLAYKNKENKRRSENGKKEEVLQHRADKRIKR